MASETRDTLRTPDGDERPKGLIDPFDAILAAALIAICGGFYYVSTGFPEPSAFLGDNVLPGEFPQILLTVIAVLALLLPFEHLIELERWPMIKKSRSAPIGATTWATIGFLILVLLAAPSAGMVLTIFFSALLLPMLWGERRWILILAYAVLFTVIVTYVFAIVLRVYFEPGLLGISVR